MSLGQKILAYAVLVAGSAVLLFPLWWMMTVSLSTEIEAQEAMGSSEIRVFPSDPQWGNYPDGLRQLGAASGVLADADGRVEIGDPWGGFKDALANSVVITMLVVAGNVLSCSLAGYGFARMRFRGSRGLFLVTLATMMLPHQVTMVPLFLLFRSLGWVDTILPLVVPSFFGTAFFIFMFRQFFGQVPEELLEAGRIDGASELGIWWRIMLPMCKPVAAITAIFTFIWTWNDFMNPLIYLQSPDKFTLALALNTFKSQFGDMNQAHLLMAASVVVMLPCVILFFAAQRYFVQGLNVGGLKG